jgi:hypothetical protein
MSLSYHRAARLLVQVDLAKTDVLDISFLGGCAALKVLDISRTKVQDLSPLCIWVASLESLSIAHTKVRYWEA